MMMMCETRQMSSNPEGLAQLEVMVKRYRNSPSIILWSIGNEEWQLQNEMAEQGAKIAATMVRRCHELDPTRVVSAAVNGDNDKGVSDAFDIIGFNYNLKFPDDFHKKHPTRPVYRLGDRQRHLHARRLHNRSAAQHVSAYDGNHTAGARPPRSGGRSTARASGRRAALRGPASTIAASPRPTAGLRSTRSSASSTCADFPRTTSTTTKRGGARSRRCTSFRTGTGRAGKATRSRCGCTPISTKSSCS